MAFATCFICVNVTWDIQHKMLISLNIQGLGVVNGLIYK